MPDDGFKAWREAELAEIAGSNYSMPTWLGNLAAAREVYTSMQHAEPDHRLDHLAKRIAKVEAAISALPPVLRKVAATSRKAGGTDLAADIKVRDLAARLDDLERRPSLAYRGLWDASAGYPANSMVTKAGAAWVSVAAAAPGEQPGKSDAWKLAAKSDTSELKRIVKEELRKEPTLR